MFTANQCMHLTAFGVGILTSRNKPSFPLILNPRLLHSQRPQLYHIQPRASLQSSLSARQTIAFSLTLADGLFSRAMKNHKATPVRSTLMGVPKVPVGMSVLSGGDQRAK